LDLDRLSEIWLKISKEAFELSSCLGFDLEVLDLGGGIGIPYQEKGIKSADVKYEALKAQLLRLKQRMPDTQIWMELGRYAIGPFGKYVTDIVDRKTVHGVNVLVTEGGVHHLLRPALVGEAFPATLLQSEAKEKKQILFEIHGPLCTALDHLGQFHLSAGTQSGDSLVFHQCGAYGFTESMPFFLCHDLPAEFVVKENVLRQVRNWQSPEGWLV